MRHKSRFTYFCLWTSNCARIICGKGYLSSTELLLHLCQKIIWAYFCMSIYGFSDLLHLSICLPLCQYHAVLITATIIILKSDRLILPTLFLFFKVVLATVILLAFNIKFRIILFIYMKKNISRVLIGKWDTASFWPGRGRSPIFPFGLQDTLGKVSSVLLRGY